MHGRRVTMRSLYATFATLALLGATATFGQSQADSSKSQGDTTTGTTVPAQQAQATPGGNDKPTKEMMATCKKMAADKKLTGDAKKAYMTDCEAGKKTREGH